MHTAPSVSYPVGRSRFAGALLLAAWMLGAVACVAWRMAAPASVPRSALAAAFVFIMGACAAWRWWCMPAGTLSWDQEQWRWRERGQAGTAPEVALDLQRWLLVRWRSGSGSNWLWLERASRPEQWSDLRRAVYSRARPETRPPAGPSAAKS